LRKSGVDAGVVVGIDGSIEIQISIQGVADEDGIGIHVLAKEAAVNPPPTAIVVENRAKAGGAIGVGGSGAGGDALAGPASWATVPAGADLVEDGGENALAGWQRWL